MSIATAIQNAQQKVANAYTAVNAKGGTLPATQNLSNLPTAIGSISTGDEITATNTTGSAISADDRVWVNGEDVYARDFTTSGNTITVDDSNRTIEITSFSDAVAYKQLSSNLSLGDNISVVIKLKLASNNGNSYIAFIGSDNSTRPFNKYIMMGKISDQVCFQIVPGNNLIYTGLYFSSIVAEQYYWFKLDIANGVATASYSIDGQSWNYGSPVNVNTSTVLGNYINFYGQTTNTSGIKTTYDCSECTVSVNNTLVWTPYTKTGTNYSIINDTDITSTSFTGIAQEAIANNATGSVKTLLDGNGTYAPTTATKSITTNGTYTASAENAYGLSSVTVDVPSAPTKKYNLLDRVKDDSNNEIGTVSGFFTDANNVEYAVVCLDAQYRLASSVWCNHQGQGTGDIVTNLPVYDSTTWGPWEAKETATFNTQKILDYCTTGGYTSTACNHCRSKSFTIDGTTYYGQLPNMIELNDIVRNHTAINTIDTTASSYSSVNFSTNKYVWSSNQYSYSNAYLAFNSGSMTNYDRTSNGLSTVMACPVLEIPNT